MYEPDESSSSDSKCCLHACMYALMHVCLCMHVCMYVCMYMCMYEASGQVQHGTNESIIPRYERPVDALLLAVPHRVRVDFLHLHMLVLYFVYVHIYTCMF